MNCITTELLSIIIPVYNEEDNVRLLVEKIHTSLRDYHYEIVFIDDFSTDKTRKNIEELNDKKVHLICLKKNYGQSLALAAGIDYASGEYIVTMDGDLQNDPTDIPKMLKHILHNDFDVVTGIRVNRKDAFLKKIPSKIANTFIKYVTKVDIKDNGCALKIFTKSTAKDLKLYGEMHRFILLLAHFEGAQIKQIPVNHHTRNSGSSKYGLGRTFKVISDILLLLFIQKFFRRPIHLFGIMGVVMSFIGVFSILLRILFFWNTISENFSFIYEIMLVFGGVQCFTIGIVLELLMRTYYESQTKKPYKIKSIKVAQ